MIKRVNSLEEYLSAINEMVTNGIYERWNADNSKEYCTGVDWDITDLETLSDTRLLEFVQPCIIENIKRLWHVYCYENNTGLSLYEGILIGLCITEEDCYYILKNGDTIKYFTCVGGICPKYNKP